ncbi:MAG TPA: hypothetical protein ENG81_01105 [Candidatus Bathyarchaeota archaeon]|nr:hypothetical protein [Candidatus Bathyarchaeota archaeon]
MATDKLTGLELEVAKLRAEFNLFRQDVKKNEYSNLVVFIKNVLFKRGVKVERNGVQYNLAPDYVEVENGLPTNVAGDTSSWINWDLSSAIPINATRVDISMQNVEDADYIAGVRQNGSSQDRYIHISNDSQIIMTANLDSDRIIERWANNANVTFAIRGYYI